MNKALLRKTVWVVLIPLVLMPAGCGGKGATVTGRVTLGGQPVESGFVTFYPEDSQGTSVGVEIVNGEYSVPDIAPGKKRIFVNITDIVEPTHTNATKSREEANAERLAGAKRKKSKSKQPASEKLDGNNKIVNVVSGSQQIDIPLEKQKSGK
jgi:hypothetical protein